MTNTGENSTFTEIGASGLEHWGGIINEEPLRRLAGEAWKRAVRDMTANDPVVNSFLFAIEMLTRQVSWKVEPFSADSKDIEQADFHRDCLFNDMSLTWQDTLSEILSFLPWGWSYLELCYKRRGGESRDKLKDSRYSDGKIGLRKIAIRAQESLDRWEFDEFDEVRAMVQIPPTDSTTRIIPYQKALHFRTSSKKNNPEGWSCLRGVYRPWYFKSNIENIEGIGIERDLAGLPVAFVPPSLLTSTKPADVALRNAVQKLLAEVKRNEKEGVMFPREYNDKGHLLFDLQLMSSGGARQFDTSKTIDRYDQRILMALMADFLLLGSKAGGSYALSTDKTELFSSALSAWLDSICDVFNRHCFPRIDRLNGWDTTRTARLTHGPVERISLKELGDYLSRLSQAKIGFDDDQANWLKRQGNIPITEKEESK